MPDMVNNNSESASVSRYKAREQAFILCFERIFADCDFEETLANAEAARDLIVSDYAYEVASGVEKSKAELDEQIAPLLSDKWSISRISKVSLCLLRIAVYEMTVLNIPQKVAVNEAVELTKKYSAEQDASFVNGVLGSFIRNNGGEIQ